MSTDETPATAPESNSVEPEEATDRQASFTRRALLQAGWTAPVILIAALPETAQAQSAVPFTDGFGD